METQTKINIGMILLMISGFTTVVVLDNDSVELTPTHYCESRELQMYCSKVTEYYCYPNSESRTGSKKCIEGWKEIPSNIKYSKQYLCDNQECVPK